MKQSIPLSTDRNFPQSYSPKTSCHTHIDKIQRLINTTEHLLEHMEAKLAPYQAVLRGILTRGGISTPQWFAFVDRLNALRLTVRACQITTELVKFGISPFRSLSFNISQMIAPLQEFQIEIMQISFLPPYSVFGQRALRKLYTLLQVIKHVSVLFSGSPEICSYVMSDVFYRLRGSKCPLTDRWTSFVGLRRELLALRPMPPEQYQTTLENKFLPDNEVRDIGKYCDITSSKQQIKPSTMDELLQPRGTEDV